MNDTVNDTVKPSSRWRHTNGNEYVVLFLTNENSTRPNYPVTVVYAGPGGHRWSRPLSDWHRSMTLIGGSVSAADPQRGNGE